MRASQLLILRIVVMAGAIGYAVGACSTSNPEIPAAEPRLRALVDSYDSLPASSTLALASATEPGTPLLILGRLVDSASRAPVANRRVSIYHSDSSGSYGSTDPNDESSARLQGTVTTDHAGRFRVATVFPGDANRHIHLGINGAHPEAYDIYFAEYIDFGLRRWAEGSSQAFIADVRKLGDRQLVLSTDIVVRGLPRDSAP